MRTLQNQDLRKKIIQVIQWNKTLHSISILLSLFIAIGLICLRNSYAIPLYLPIIGSSLLVAIILNITTSQRLYNYPKLLYNDTKRLNSIIKAKIMHDRETDHELRMPLGNINGISQLLIDEDTSEEERKELIIDLRRSTDLLIDYLNYSTQYAKFENEDSPPLSLEIFSLRGCLNSILLLLTNRTYGLNVKIELSIAENVPIDMYSERVTVMQIIGNLLSNAIKFSVGKCDLVTLRVSWDSPTVIISIEDKGKGIKQELLPRIFEPFVTTFNEHKPGTGIGLSLTKKHVQRLEGTIKVHSIEDEGTTFTVTLPLIKDHK